MLYRAEIVSSSERQDFDPVDVWVSANSATEAEQKIRDHVAANLRVNAESIAMLRVLDEKRLLANSNCDPKFADARWFLGRVVGESPALRTKAWWFFGTADDKKRLEAAQEAAHAATRIVP